MFTNLRKLTGPMTIVIAESDVGLRYTLWRLLRADKHRVIATRNGEEALKVMRSVAVPVDFVIADFDTPAMDGLELCRCIAKEHPEIRVLLISDGVTGIDEIQRAGLPFISKPFTAFAIRRRIEAVLQQGGVLSHADNEADRLVGSGEPDCRD